MCNALRANRMTVGERLAEVAGILAIGLIRLHGRKSSPLSPKVGESSLDCPAYQSGHANALNDGGLE
jgi:hypothetical protein